MTPSKPDTPDTLAAKKRLDEAVEAREEAIDAAHRTFWTAVAAEIEAKNLTQVAAAAHLDYSREQIRKQIKRYTQD